MNQPAPLDKWEILMIRACKRNNTSLARFRRILGIRCGLDRRYVDDGYVARFLMELVERLGYVSLSEFVLNLNSTEVWKFGRVAGCELDPNGSPIRHREKIITLCVGYLSGMAVIKLPGYHPSGRWRRRAGMTPEQANKARLAIVPRYLRSELGGDSELVLDSDWKLRARDRETGEDRMIDWGPRDVMESKLAAKKEAGADVWLLDEEGRKHK
jgi:hypothetical protein